LKKDEIFKEILLYHEKVIIDLKKITRELEKEEYV